MCYDEDEGPEVNLEGNLHILSSLQQVTRSWYSMHSMHSMAC
jgi:hypothetical protein